MTFANARNMYRRSEAAAPVEATDPHEIISVTLTELKRALEILAAAKEEGLPYPGHYLNRAFTAIYILQSSLDFEKGGEIASTLFSVYEFCRLQVADAFARKNEAKLREAAGHIEGILQAWSEMKPRLEATDAR
ncbi:MAG: flagellar protein FliS [Marivivens sp.]|jgi:flagellar protein FliS|nr:flagellar protein FliS [Marivivens sp.]